jgi:dTDP-4-amino-4,6-dideoxygalactose transaminase
MKIRENTQWNYSYFPVIFNSEEELLRVQKQLNAADIFPRRYFYPSLNTIDFVKGEAMPISESIASKILCLPLYVGLEKQDLEKITTIINTKVLC